MYNCFCKFVLYLNVYAFRLERHIKYFNCFFQGMLLKLETIHIYFTPSFTWDASWGMIGLQFLRVAMMIVVIVFSWSFIFSIYLHGIDIFQWHIWCFSKPQQYKVNGIQPGQSRTFKNHRSCQGKLLLFTIYF